MVQTDAKGLIADAKIPGYAILTVVVYVLNGSNGADASNCVDDVGTNWPVGVVGVGTSMVSTPVLKESTLILAGSVVVVGS